MARGLDALTIRTLGRTAPPDEDWVDITYRTGSGSEREVRVRWNTYQPLEPSPFGDAQQAFAAAAGDPGRLAALGIDAQTTTVNLVRRDLFARGWQTWQAAGADELPTELPGALRARICHTSIGDVLHVRIFTFLVPDPAAFVDEFLRLCHARPSAGLIVDVRGNGGGDIRAAEQLLQVLTPRRIEPEPAQFIVSPLIRQLCSANQRGEINLSAWAKSVQDAVETGASFSTGFPIGSADEANSRGQGYYGPVVLVTDARCYSATDIFAAGFQDHGIGPVLGLAEYTGAGGANVWTHDLLRQLLPARNTPLKPLPRQATFRVAIRRTTRVGAHAGELLEDLGVASSEIHHSTQDDLLQDNKDLLEAAAGLMAGRVARCLEADFEPTAEGMTIQVRSAGLDRVDAYIDQRPVGSQDVRHDRCAFHVPHTLLGPGPQLRLAGFERGVLAAVRVAAVPNPDRPARRR